MDAPDIRHRPLDAIDGDTRGSGGIRTAILVIAAIAVCLYLIEPILLPFVVAGIVAYVCTPLLDWLATRSKIPRAVFAVVMFLLLLGITGLTVAVAGQRLVIETGKTLSELQETLEQLLTQTNGGTPIQLLGISLSPETVHIMFDRVRDWLNQPDTVALLARYSLFGIIGIFLTAILLIWLLITGPSVVGGLFWLVPPRRRALVARIWARLDPHLKHYFIGIAVTVIYATIASYIGLALILGLNHALLLSLLTGVAETLPFIGSTAAAILAGLVALHTATGLKSIAAFTIYAIVLRLSIDQLVAPLVLGKAANVHPVLIIFCFLAGAVTFGVVGVILSVPIALTVKATLAELYADEDAK
jgi:predicted PurR-regulated permease PerM